ncbi:hypothetical protein Esti_006268 [Eimeria stiedai]
MQTEQQQQHQRQQQQHQRQQQQHQRQQQQQQHQRHQQQLDRRLPQAPSTKHSLSSHSLPTFRMHACMCACELVKGYHNSSAIRGFLAAEAFGCARSVPFVGSKRHRQGERHRKRERERQILRRVYGALCCSLNTAGSLPDQCNISSLLFPPRSHVSAVSLQLLLSRLDFWVNPALRGATTLFRLLLHAPLAAPQQQQHQEQEQHEQQQQQTTAEGQQTRRSKSSGTGPLA